MTPDRQRVRPNVIVVLVDTLRADHLSCYGYPRQTSPWLDRIAEQGVLYESAISPAAWTPPAHASLFTGAYPSRHGVDRSRLLLGPALTPLPEVLRHHGYRTFGVSSNYWLSRETGFNRGFDRYVHSWQLVQARTTNLALQRQHRSQDLGLKTLAGGARNHGVLSTCGNTINSLYEGATRGLRRALHAYDSGAWRVNRIVRHWVSEWKRSDRPFFAFIHYMEPHLRYDAPGRYRTLHVPAGVTDQRIEQVNQDPWRYLTGRAEMGDEDLAILQGLYDGEISYVDGRVGQLYSMLHDHGILRNTLLVITSDHGENLGEHRFMDHAYCLYDTLLQVPLIVCGTEEFGRGERIRNYVQTLDLFPTIMELAGVRDEKVWAQVQGRPLFPVDVRSQPERVAIAEYLEPQPPVAVLRRRYPEFDASRFDRTLRTVRQDGYKYIWASDRKDELYDLSKDPREEHNLISVETARADTLRASLAEWLTSFHHTTSHEADVELELDTITRKRLEDLGYLT